jgi:hypothetical protein
MSLLNSASLCVTPNGYKASTLYSVIPNTTLGDMTVVRATTATRVNSAGLIESVANNVPRLDYSNGTCPSILVEPQRSNNFQYSSQFDNAYWTKVAATVTANNIVSPSGIQDAEKVEFNSGYINGTATVADNQTYTISFFAKKGTANLFQISEAFYVGTTVAFDLNTGTVTSGTGSIEDYGNGWYRCSMQFTYGVGQVVSSWVIRNYQAGYIYIWGAQLEAGSYPTSYIPTTSAAVTRNADVISKTGISALIGQTEGTIFWDIYVETPTATDNENILNIDNGSFGNTIYILKGGGATLTAEMYSGGSAQASFTKTSIVKGRYKCAIAYANNNTAFFVNGVQVGSTDTSCTVPATSRFQMGQGALGASVGNINSVVLFPTRLTNAELASLTTL